MANLDKALFNGEFLERWYQNYHECKAYSRGNKPAAEDVEDELKKWVYIQGRIRHMLPPELRSKLSALDIDFEEKGHTWESMYRQLASYAQQNGHVCLPSDQRHEDLKDWLIRQVIGKRLLAQNQFQRLDRLGVDWGMFISRDYQWEQMYLRLKDFHDIFSHCRVPQNWPKDKQLALWVLVQRRMRKKDKLREDREQKLSKLGFVWDIRAVRASRWEMFLQQLTAFYRAHGHCRVPGKYEKLVGWIERQRLARKNNSLSVERVQRLDEIDFTWSCEGDREKCWDSIYTQLRAYQQKHGHCFVPVNYKENKTLGTWVGTQRTLEARGKLDLSKKKKLDELGFVWSRDAKSQLNAAYDAQWVANYEKLKDHKRVYGSCQVSLKVDPTLQRWTCWQRRHFYQGKLSQDRISLLNEIFFPWSLQEEYWMKMYNALAAFRDKFAHTEVPSQWEPNQPLAAWVYKVKSSKAELSPQKIELLDKLGFNWTLIRKTVVPWHDMYDRLVRFKQEHGHTRVPANWPEDPKFSKWVCRMRHKRGKLDPGRISLLQAIEFTWNAKKSTGALKHHNQTQVC
ncbi:helicase associated domain-containing protein [Rufibacter tibetensis]|uniref:Helicase-associated domain-containing protein n=1 Tax=Rufibacter tibetensis TaxID=512763 RepID=A0A0P0C8J7_9BACT|nr:helicase associated domain-containing protein [Rufibacter tibetensis]ALJ01647.1 hypothetical protein DC20_21530 [Rufibacter tibetensis]